MNPLVLLSVIDFVMIKFVVAIVFGAIWLINYLLSGRQQKVPPVVHRPGRRANPQQPAGTSQPRTSESLSSEIEQFLKEAALRKGEKGRRGQSVRSPIAVPQPLVTLPPIDIAPETSGESVTASVQRHLDTREFATRASSMTQDMKRADSAREKHLQDTFGHKIGRLADTSQVQQPVATGGQTESAANMGSALRGLLAKPENVKQAIVLAEILRRPEDRW